MAGVARGPATLGRFALALPSPEVGHVWPDRVLVEGPALQHVADLAIALQLRLAR